MTSNDRHRLGFIGLGSMGSGMAARLAESGYDIAVYNRTRSKSEALQELGARVADSPADAAREADVVMLSLADQKAVTSLVFGDDGVAGSLRSGGYIVDMSTVAPDFAREFAEDASGRGYRALDARVLGAPQHARTGELRVMVGGSEDDFHAVEDVLNTIGKEVTYLGESGLGATMKLVLNMLMGVQMPALAEAVVFGERAGLPREKILEMIANSGYSSPVMSFRCPMMERRSFHQAAFRLSLMRKDMMLVLGEALELGVLELPHELGGDRAVVLETGSVVDPLPDLGARDLRRGGVLHQPVDARRAVAAQP
jgi:3-hydroxyisobutyrate dehydrogenase